MLRDHVPTDEAWQRAITQLRERGPELAELASALAATRQGRRPRLSPGFGRMTIWDGAYDTSPWTIATWS